MPRWMSALIVAASLGLTTASTAAVPAFARPARTELVAVPSFQDAQGLPAGLSATVLANYEVAVTYPGTPNAEMQLERIPLHPGDDVDGRDPDDSGAGRQDLWADIQVDGIHLLHIETGEVVVATADGEATYRQGESAFVPGDFVPGVDPGRRPAQGYHLRNDTGECAAVLRLSVRLIPIPPEGMQAIPGAPRGPARGCGEYERLFVNRFTYPWPDNHPAELPVRLFIERYRWDASASLSSAFLPGARVLLVESGKLTLFTDKDADSPGVLVVEVPAGGLISIEPGVSLGVSADAGTAALMAGIEPVAP